ncbi:hypothetical protein LUZ60_002101 [Juncus effusus]|nr:hypothetical protein LUZ60_002101 [Juncus effusus]
MSPQSYSFLSFIVTILFLSIPTVHPTNPTVTDISKLFSLRNSLSQPRDSLPSWFDSETPPCNWSGIKCVDRTVISIDLFLVPLKTNFPEPVLGFGSLKRLNLSGCGLTGRLPESIGSDLRELEILDLSNNELFGPLPSSISNLTNLKQLILDSNSFSGKLESGIGNLKCLTKLSVSGNSFSGNLPTELGELRYLELLDLSVNIFTGSVPASLANLTKLLYLDLSRNGLTGNLFPNIGSWVNILTLDLSSNGLTGQIPSSIGKLAELESLWLYSNGFTGQIPIEIGNLERLKVLSLASCKLSGSLPYELTNLKALTDLDISVNGFEGELPGNIGELKELTLFIAANAGLTGQIPENLGDCTKLKMLDLSFNAFTGPLPDSFAKLESISTFIVEGNQLTGPIPEWIRNWKAVNSLRFAKNRFNGSLPALPLQFLTTFSADSNKLSGEISPKICDAISLNLLSLSENELTGSINETFKRCLNLTDLILSANKITGEIPTYLSDLPLVTLEISQNNLTGSLPDKLFESETLLELSLSHNGLTGRIPESLGRLSGLQRLQLDNNLFEGSIPFSIGKLKNLTNLSLYGNKLSGEIPIQLFTCRNLVALDLGSNQLNGSIPDSISELNQLDNLVLSNNQLTGSIPGRICNGFSEVSFLPDSEFNQHYGVLDLSFNGLTGRIPVEMKQCVVLRELRLQGNKLTGGVPSELFQLTNLTYLDLSFNNLSGPIQIFSLRNLQGLILSHNGFTGQIPSDIGSVLPSLVKLNLSCNSLSGFLPDSVFGIKTLADLDVSENSLSGPLPFSRFTGTSSLLIINASNNNFSGRIENSISNFTSLSVLDLHGNRLTGTLPPSITKLDYLTYLDLSENQFQDSVPCGICSIVGLSFVNFSGNGFHGFNPENCALIPDFGSNNNNPCLASHIAPLVAYPPPHPSNQASVWRVILGIVTAFTIILIALLIYKLVKSRSLTLESISNSKSLKSGSSIEPASSDELLSKRRTKEPLSINLATFEHSLLRVTANDILKATDNFSKVHILGDGGFGTVYKAFLQTGVVAVKRLHGGSHFGGGDREFLAEMETIGKVKHKNLVPLLGYCVFRDERFLIYEYMENGSLEGWLREKGEDLGWGQRLNVMFGSAKGLAFLHHGFVPHIIHRDMKSSNILLDKDFEPRVSDFGLARIISACETHVSTDLAGTFGYIPPEYGLTMKCTIKGDVYSFGVVMMELLTGRAPTGQEDGEGGGNLVGWVKWMVSKEKQNEVFDPCLPLVGPARLQMARVLDVARVCTSDDPWRRPSMFEVVRMLKEIRMMDGGDSVVVVSSSE